MTMHIARVSGNTTSARLFMDYLCLMLLSRVLLGSFGLFTDYKENTELIQQRPGYDIKLQCGLNGLVDQEKLRDIKVHWYFKQCRENFFTSNNCQNFQEDDWIQLPCEENFCQPDLLLRNVTENYSGLYKCTVYPYQINDKDTLDIQLVRTYQLDVKNTTIALPEFMGMPLNRTVKSGEQVVFQCRVHSEVHPTIMWFRRRPDYRLTSVPAVDGHSSLSSRIVKYNGHTYELIQTAREKLISNEVYLSKLILSAVVLQDDGFYACVAISYRGHRIREAYLKVLAPSEVIDEDKNWSDYDSADESSTDPKEFLLLFLMPLGLAMLPITVWLCYLCYKKCKSNTDIQKMNHQFFDEENVTDHCVLRA